MFRHHPAFVETGELEIAQRAAMHAADNAVMAATREAGVMSNHDANRVAIEAYLAEMRRVWQPEAIEIEEGDYVIVRIGEDGGRSKIAVERDSSGTLRLSLDDGDEVHYGSILA